MKHTHKFISIKSVGAEFDFKIKKTIALAGNPNVGKSTLFNALTGMHQHTGNWSGKTVATAIGEYEYKNHQFVLVDLPGTYSLYAHSKEEEVASDFLCFENSDAVIIVCDATCLERNLNLVLQTLEITDNAIVCVNLMDEANKKNIKINLDKLSELLGVPVIGTSAKSKKGFDKLSEELLRITAFGNSQRAIKITYTKPLEQAIKIILDSNINEFEKFSSSKRRIALKCLEEDENILSKINIDKNSLDNAKKILSENGISKQKLSDTITSCTVLTAEGIANECVHIKNSDYSMRDRKIDRILTDRLTGIPIMLLLLGVIFWLTVSGANIPSAMLSNALFKVQDWLLALAQKADIPEIIYSPLILGVFRVVSWVVSVMLPPMTIFFPLFTILEDLGYLPRIAFNLDKTFKKCSACGKQALTMCMGFGCNAVGVVGCRIIDSPRERLIAILTNSLVPCNGRFPTLIALISMFFTFSVSGVLKSLAGTALLMGIIILGVLMTFLTSKLLSKTLLKGESSSFTLELPPYRVPNPGRIIIRSVLDRTLFVLGRALKASAPAGLLIWILANVTLGDMTLLSHCSAFLDPFARLLGLDGVILLAFILGIPANEIVIPIIIMAYLQTGTITDFENIFFLKELFLSNGWTTVTALNTMLFSLMHWPCATTIMTIYKETLSLKWTLASVLIPTACGMVFCFLINLISMLF